MPSIFKCPDCGKPFTSARSMRCHQGGAHRRGTLERDGKAFCKHCKAELIAEGPKKNWPDWAIKQGNHICSTCKASKLKVSNDKRRLRAIITRKRNGVTTKTPFKPGHIH